MDRTMPIAHNEEIELYLRTYYSLLRSSEPIRIRSLEETHAAMNSTIHYQADSDELDVSALVYSALRVPECLASTSLMVMGQMEEVFQRAGYDVESWQPVRARARRRKLFFDNQNHILAAFVSSVTDIDDLIPCIVAFQIEWNKLHVKLMRSNICQRLAKKASADGYLPMDMLEELRLALDVNSADLTKLCQLWPGSLLVENLRKAENSGLDIRVTVLGSGLSDYRRSVQFWWQKVAEGAVSQQITERPLYFVSSNTHSLVNLVGGYAWDYADEIAKFLRRENPEGLWEEYQLLSDNDRSQYGNFYYYTLRLLQAHPLCPPDIANQIQAREREVGIARISNPHCLDVEAQVLDVARINPAYLDPRLQIFDDEDWALLRQSDALIFNIDYPLGMAAYHLFSQVSTATERTLGVYILGKAATLNGRVGDVMIPNVVYDEHSRNSYLFRNCFTAQDVAPFLSFGTVFDNQKAVTVRGTFLQNRDFMHVFYEEGYTDIEMEAGPYLSGIYEDIYPRRYPTNEIVNLFINAPYDIGLIHYASDTPISKRQTLLSKSMSYFGVDATYATSVAVLRRILSQEVTRLKTEKKVLPIQSAMAAKQNGAQTPKKRAKANA
ncbi:MAG: hypothetical protein H6641_05485 [Caldilineaceae bacterium]|nr:hypothetical protein [Caldilineaceae bacterium]